MTTTMLRRFLMGPVLSVLVLLAAVLLALPGRASAAVAAYNPPTVTGQCLRNGALVQWTVFNPNTVDISGSWTQGAGPSGTFSATANSTDTFITPTGDPVTITVTTPAGVALPITSAAVTCSPGYQPPTVTGKCWQPLQAGPPTNKPAPFFASWTVHNPNPYPITVVELAVKPTPSFTNSLDVPAHDVNSFTGGLDSGSSSIQVVSPAGHPEVISAAALDCQPPPCTGTGCDSTPPCTGSACATGTACAPPGCSSGSDSGSGSGADPGSGGPAISAASRTQAESLPFTGSQLTPEVLLGCLLLVFGGALLAVSRRRERYQPRHRD